MENSIAYCGLSCESCPIYLATLEQDEILKQKMRELIAEECSTLYSINLSHWDISDCDGCRSETGRLFSGCYQCEIRKCAASKDLESCGYCSGYACEILEKHFSLEPGARKRLDIIRKTFLS